MNSRMEKYDSNQTISKRTKRNENLYGDLSEHVNIDYVNINVDNAIELDSKAMNRVTREGYKKKREFDGLVNKRVYKEYDTYDEDVSPENKVYDINEILKLARQDKLFDNSDKKRLLNTEYNILTKLDIDDIEGENIKKEDLKSLINDIYEQEAPKKVKSHSRSEDQDLFNDLIPSDSKDTIREEIKLNEELSEDILLKESDNTIKNEVFDKDDKNKEEIATKMDTTGFDSIINNTIEEEKEGKGLMVAIIIVTILILLTVAFFVLDYFFGLKF